MVFLGIIGRIAPDSTIDYYSRVIACYRVRQNDGIYPIIHINRIGLSLLLAHAEAKVSAAIASFLIEQV